MTIYNLTYVCDTDNGFDASSVSVFTSLEKAQKAMLHSYRETLRTVGFSEANVEEENYCGITERFAYVCDGLDRWSWHITKADVPVKVAVEVHGGMVTNIYATADVEAEVYDEDYDSLSEERFNEAQKAEGEFGKIICSADWKKVW